MNQPDLPNQRKHLGALNKSEKRQRNELLDAKPEARKRTTGKLHCGFSDFLLVAEKTD